MNLPFANLAPHSRIWIFQSDRFLTASETDFMAKTMNNFIPQWAAHGNDLYGAFSVKENLFLVVGVDESKSPASGCSIDTLTRTVKDLGAHLGIDFFNRMAIAYVNHENKIELVSMAQFKHLIAENKVDHNTTVFNNLVNSKAEFDHKWRTEVRNSWHTNLFQLV